MRSNDKRLNIFIAAILGCSFALLSGCFGGETSSVAPSDGGTSSSSSPAMSSSGNIV